MTAELSWVSAQRSSADHTGPIFEIAELTPVVRARLRDPVEPSRTPSGVMKVSSESVVLQSSLPHDVPQQHAEHGVRHQAHEDGTHALIEPQQALGATHLQQAVQEAGVEATLLRSREQNRRHTHTDMQTSKNLLLFLTHLLLLVHRLVVQPRADDVERRHGDCYGNAANHGCHQSDQPAVRTEPLWDVGRGCRLNTECCWEIPPEQVCVCVF